MKELRGTEWYGEYATLTDEHNDYIKLDIKNPIIRINTGFKGYSSTKKVTILPRIYHN